MPDSDSYLNSLSRRLLSAVPSYIASSWLNPQDQMGGMVPGQAQTRLGHSNVFIQPQAQFQQTAQDYRVPGAEALTTPEPTALDKALSFLHLNSSPLAKSAAAGPTVVMQQPEANSLPNQQWGSDLRHEAVHALTHGAENKISPQAAQNLLPPQSADAIAQLSKFYNPQQMTQEILARSITEPTTLGLKSTPEDDPQNAKGKLVASQMADMLEKNGFKQQADQYRNYFGLGGKQGIRDDTQSFQKPNEVF